ncbi:uncharacterized protein LOC105693818 [Athalia rosae]|uniref:uncharacterized protein LOC105693818 n=1 Tax=Athalia rosae TaxID=37344 RepID=UPI00203353F4|nr:uncharacterized protein LOC105693818 [Athalia rosae]
MKELLDCDIESILLNKQNNNFPHNQKIAAACAAFFNIVSNCVTNENALKHDYEEKIQSNTTIISDTYSRITDLQNELSDIALQHQVLDKQRSDIFKRHQIVQEEIDEQRSKKESLTFEVAELEKELEESKVMKRLKWDGLKRATKAYKSYLQFSIQITDSTEISDKVRVIFFKPVKTDTPQYFVDLIHTSGLWKVELIHPSLKSKDEEQLQCVVNFKNQRAITDITAFLCILRKIFKKQLNT